MNDLIPQIESELREAIYAIQQPRTDFQLRHFVVGQHDTDPRRWSQCVLELSLKIHLLKRAKIECRIAERKIAEMRAGGMEDEAELAELDLEQHDLAVIGAAREAETLYAIYKAFGRTYSHDELMAAEAEYWKARLARQAKHSLVATGRIGIGDLDSLQQIGWPITAETIRRLELETCETFSNGPSLATDSTPAKSLPTSMPRGWRPAIRALCSGLASAWRDCVAALS